MKRWGKIARNCPKNMCTDQGGGGGRESCGEEGKHGVAAEGRGLRREGERESCYRCHRRFTDEGEMQDNRFVPNGLILGSMMRSYTGYKQQPLGIASQFASDTRATRFALREVRSRTTPGVYRRFARFARPWDAILSIIVGTICGFRANIRYATRDLSPLCLSRLIRD